MRLETPARAPAKIGLYIVPRCGMLCGRIVVLRAAAAGGRAVFQDCA